MNKQCIVILYEGLAPNEYIINGIAEAFESNCVTAGDITISHLDESSIIKAIASKAIETPIEQAGKPDPEKDPMTAAAIVMNGRYGALIGQSTLFAFVTKLTSDLQEAKAKIAFNPSRVNINDKALIEAVDVISDVVVPPAIARKYHISKDVVEAIQYVRQTA